MTLAEKILAAHTDKKKVSPGEFINVKVDLVLANDITAPIAIFLTMRYWRAPSSLIPRTKVRFILAFCIAGCQIAGWVMFFSQVIPSTNI